jgi:hypothetical protein
MSAGVMAVLRNRVAEVESKWGAPEGSDKQGREALAAVAAMVERQARYRQPHCLETTNIHLLTYTDQPNNVEAWRLGESCRKARPGGDYIDRGLSLLFELHARGYGIVRIPPMDAAKAEEVRGLFDSSLGPEPSP